ncbi:unnamed protein product [Didymodactylos carnosus]|uniref:Uncharacterized protein n=1 Tax=Didymodactylos carnosus TaxID=1234261 RepID=A0A815AA64_9BILA|nr:unnamed protein product [Didymodactylos carnosus]CAF1273427.1 unnamed protein product [Didymodactylos carnosus]CAF4025051.1 unnamed protein product [Didymodactylos carnosus]CAF4078690.1 unnamed protein product [Didymodactylos carnosus]
MLKLKTIILVFFAVSYCYSWPVYYPSTFLFQNNPYLYYVDNNNLQINSYIRSCLQYFSYDRLTRHVSYNFLTCNGHYLTKINYKIRILNGRIELLKSILIQYDGPNRQLQMICDSMINYCYHYFRSFYLRYGLYLKLKIYCGTSDDESITKINVTPYIDYVDANNWAIKFDVNTGEVLNDPLICRINLHELTHLFGLEDAYYDHHCPNRQLQSYYNLMTNPWTQEYLELTFNQIEKILYPLCNDR